MLSGSNFGPSAPMFTPTHRATQLAPAARYTSSEWRSNLTLSPTSEYSANFT